MPAKTLCHYKWVQASCIRCSYCTDHTHLLLSLSPGFLEMTSTSLCPPYLSLTSFHSFSWPSHLHFSFHHVQLYFSPSEVLSFPQSLKSSTFVNIMLKNNNNNFFLKKRPYTPELLWSSLHGTWCGREAFLRMVHECTKEHTNNKGTMLWASIAYQSAMVTSCSFPVTPSGYGGCSMNTHC